MASTSAWPVHKRGHRRPGRRTVVACLVLSALLHGVLLWQLGSGRQDEPAPLQARLERFLKRPVPSRRALVRRMARPTAPRPLVRAPAAKHRGAARAPSAVPSLQAPHPALAVRLHAPAALALPMLPAPTPQLGSEPQMTPHSVDTQRLGGDRVDLGLELIDPANFDTGRHRSVILVDPADRQGLKGYLHLASVTSPTVERAEAEDPFKARASFWWLSTERSIIEKRMLQGLADIMHERTGVAVDVTDALSLSDPQLLSAPFVLFTVGSPFELGRSELHNLGAYLTSGGFLFAEVVRRPVHDDDLRGVGERSLRGTIRAALATARLREHRDWAFTRLDPGHPLFHCFYEISSLPRGWWDSEGQAGPEARSAIPRYIETIEVDGHVVGILSHKNYSEFWLGRPPHFSDTMDKGLERAGFELVERLGVNILVYALTREGSLAQKLVAAE